MEGTTRATYTLTLDERIELGAAYHILRFGAPGQAGGLAARAGQFAMLRGSLWGEAPLLPRPMSLLTAGEAPSILIKVVGDGTRRMARAARGDTFDVLAPLGERWSILAGGADVSSRAVLVAGGVGVAPLLFLARELAAMGAPRPLALYGGRSAADLPLADELAQVADLQIATEDGSRGEKGRVTMLVDALISAGAGDARIFTCGPDAMMAAVAERAAAAGIACEASLETPMACGYGVCLGCPVPRAAGGFLYACVEGPCVDARTIAWRREVRP